MREQRPFGIDHKLLCPHRNWQFERRLLAISKDARQEAQAAVGEAGIYGDSGYQAAGRVLLQQSCAGNRFAGTQADLYLVQGLGGHSRSAHPAFKKPIQRLVTFKLKVLGKYLFECLLQLTS